MLNFGAEATERLWRNTFIAAAAFVFSLCTFLLVVVFTLQIARTLEVERRLWQQAEDERRLENRMAWKELGIEGLEVENHDISRLMRAVEKHYEEIDDVPQP